MFGSLKQNICSIRALANITLKLISYYYKTILQLILCNLIVYFMLFDYIYSNFNLDNLLLKSMLCSLIYIFTSSITSVVLYCLVKNFFNMVPLNERTIIDFICKYLIKVLSHNMFYFLSTSFAIYLICFFSLVDDNTNIDDISFMRLLTSFLLIPLFIYIKTMLANSLICILDYNSFSSINRNLELNKGRKMLLGAFSYFCFLIYIIFNCVIIYKYRGTLGSILGAILNSLLPIFFMIYNSYLSINLDFVFTLPENYSDHIVIKNVYTYYNPDKCELMNPPNSNSKAPNDYTDKYDYLEDYIKKILEDSNKLND